MESRMDQLIDRTDRPAIAVMIDTEAIEIQLLTSLREAGHTVMPARDLDHLETSCEAKPCGLVFYEINGDAPRDYAHLITQLKLATRGAEIVFVESETPVKDFGSGFTRDLFGVLTAPIADSTLQLTTERALERHRMRREMLALREQIAMQFGFDNVVGDSEIMASLKASAQRVAPTEIPVMLTGPGGSGKSLLAHTIHFHSERRDQPFHIFDCNVIPADRHEAELFGEPDAGGYRLGLLEKADGGTLMIDAVQALHPQAQMRLQQFLQNQRLTRATDGIARKLDIRFISSVSIDPDRAIEDNVIREELYYRLNVVTLTVPSLQQRKDDLPLLADYFLRRQQPDGMVRQRLSPEALELLTRHRWPGNVRELENTMKRAAALSDNEIITEQDISFLHGAVAEDITANGPAKSTLTIKGGLLDSGQRSLIIKALNDNNWNYTRTAAELGIGRTTLWRKIKKYKLKEEAPTA